MHFLEFIVPNQIVPYNYSKIYLQSTITFDIDLGITLDNMINITKTMS